MQAWRLLKLETHDAFTNMAVDEAILTSRIADIAPNTIRFYRWKPSAVSIGKFQDIHNEVQLDECRKLGVDVVRRITGGGTVYHDAEDEITYSVVASKQDLHTSDIAEVYARIYAGMVEALKTLGITADFSEGNQKTCPNLTIKGKKVSGSAQAHKSAVVLQHGTLLLNVDLRKMFIVLRVPWAKTCMQVVDIAKNKITSINLELGRKVSIEEANDALTKGFEKALNVKLNESTLTAYELELAEKLSKEKYANEQWNLHAKSQAS
jgi:lipoate-protein ligase A